MTDAEILDRLDRLESMVRTLLRQKITDKSSRIVDELKERGRLSSKEVSVFLNVSRTHALSLMEKAAQVPGVVFVRGDPSKGAPTQLVYDASQIIKHQHERLAAFLDKRGSATLSEVMHLLDVDLAGARRIVEAWITQHREWEFDTPHLRARRTT